MTEPTCDTSLPYHIFVERLGPQSKGKKFYSGAETEQDAINLCAKQNAAAKERAKKSAKREQYEYTWEEVGG